MEDGRRLPALRVGHPRNSRKAVSVMITCPVLPQVMSLMENSSGRGWDTAPKGESHHYMISGTMFKNIIANQ
jgi:hypothetical protein